MGACQSIRNCDSSALFCTVLQKLIHYLATIAVAVIFSGPTGLRAQGDIRVPPHAYMPPDFPATVNAVIPTPQYLPPGYELWTIKRPLAGGFGTGKAEIEVQYKDPGCWARKIHCSIRVFVSPMTDRPFSGTAGQTPDKLTLRIGRRTVEGQYFSGVERNSTPGGRILLHGDEPLVEAGNYNALVFAFDRFMIGIRGNRQAGVGRSELIKLAKSLTYTAR